jgi:hypothetical protein
MRSAMTKHPLPVSTVLLALLSGCGGGGGGGGGGDEAPPSIDDATRSAAATTTAQTNAACNAIQPFYWEVGDRDQKRASGSVGSSPVTYTEDTRMSIASASKWIYGAYVVQRRGNAGLTANDITYLNFRSGYHSMSPLSCGNASSVSDCLATGSNGIDSGDAGPFHYNGGHMQKHAVDLGLGAMNDAQFATEVQSWLGLSGIAYTSPQPAGGVVTRPRDYAEFLRKLLRRELAMADQLGTHAVCASLGCGARYTPVPAAEHWSYSIGHWYETDPVLGDLAYSSAGAFGFYPWIDHDKRWYGVVARMDTGSLGDQAGFASASCGRLIRKAWVDGKAQ